MERNRESRRASTSSVVGGSGTGSGLSSSSRRSSRPKDASDDDDRMDEVGEPRSWDRQKKDRHSSIHGSSNSRSKRRRHGLPQDSHSSGRMVVSAEDADESTEETETAAASEDDDEPPPPSFARKPVKHRPREDEIVMDIPNVPRKARSWISASSRFLSMSKRQQESASNENSPNHHLHQHKSPVTAQTFENGNVSPTFHQKQSKRLKPMGTKFRPAKSPKVLEPCSISDQEAEVAEALFVLARSTPSQSGLLESKVEVRTEKAARRASPSPPPLHSQTSLVSASDTGQSPGNPPSHGNPSNGYTSNSKESNKFNSEAPKRKRPRANVNKQEDEGLKQEEKTLSASQQLVDAVSPSHSPSSLVQAKLETDVSSERNQPISAEGCIPSSATHRDVVQDDSSNSMSVQVPKNEETRVISVDQENMEISESKDQSTTKAQKEEPDSKTDPQADERTRPEMVKATTHTKQEPKNTDIKIENDAVDAIHLSSRNNDENDQDLSKPKIDLMAPPPMKHPLTEDTQEKSICNDSSVIPSGSSCDAACRSSQETKEVLKDNGKVLETERGSLAIKQQLDEKTFDLQQESEGTTIGHAKTEILTSSFQIPKEGDRDRSSESLKFHTKTQKEDASKVSNSSAPGMLTGWIGGLPQMSYYSPGGTPWPGGGSIPNPNIDVKAAHPAMQVPHGAMIPPVQRMKRCATHVYLAHFIYREQRISQHSLWSAAICRAAPYNLNIPPVNIHDNEKVAAYGDATRKSSAPQSGAPYGYSVSQGSSIGPTSTVSTPNPSNPAGVIDTTAGSTTSNVMAAQQYLQAMMQQNGFPSFPFPFTGPPGQGTQFFNPPFFPPHLMPPIPQLQSMTQAPGSVHPLQKQQGMGSSTPSLSPTTQQLQLQLASHANVSTQQLQHNHMATAAQCFGSRPDKDNSVENISMPDSKLCAVQRNVSDQGVSNLPNLNMSPSIMLASNMPAMHSHDPDFSSSGGKQSNTSLQIGGQTMGSASPAVQQQQQFIQHNVGSGPNMQKKVLEQTISHAYSNMPLSGTNRAAIGPGTHGVVPVGQIMAAQGHGLLPDNARLHVQQQPSYSSTQQYQRNMAKGTPGEDVYTGRGQDYMDDKKQPMKHVGTIPQFTRVELEASSSSIQGSPTSSGGPQANRIGTPNVGRALNSSLNPDSRSTRPVSGGNTGQVPILQSQTPKQNINRSKVPSGTNLGGTMGGQNMSGYVDKGIPGTMGKFPGNVLYPGQQSITTNSGPKQNQGNIAKNSQRTSQVQPQQQITSSALSKGQMQQLRTGQQSVVATPPRMMPAASQPVLTSVNLPMSASQSVPKSAPVAANKSPSNGKGSVPASKTAPTKKSSGSGPIAGNMPGGQNMPNKSNAVHQKNQGLSAPQFQQQQPSNQQQRLTTNNQSYNQLQSQQNQYNQSPYRSQVFISQQPQQYMQQTHGHQQLQQSPSQTPSPVHHYQSNSQGFTVTSQTQPPPFPHDAQTSHQNQPASSPASSNVLSLGSPNLNIQSSMTTTVNNLHSSDGIAVKAAYNPGGTISDINPSGYNAGVSQTNSPHSASQFLQPAMVKSVDQKTSSDATDQDDTKNGRHIVSSPSQSAILH